MAAATATRTTAATASAQQKSFRAKPLLSRSIRGPSTSASTPNLNTVYIAQSRRLQPSLPRKSSLAALTSSTLASIPDDSESYGLDTVLSETSDTMASTGQGKPAADEIVVGDAVDVPGAMHGTVRFVGTVQGKKGTFAGIELHPDFAPRGKNSGDVEGISYFDTTVPGSGIFVPVSKASRRGSPLGSAINSFPMTPTPGAVTGAKNDGAGRSYTPPTPALQKFSASVGPGVRAPSPLGKKPRTSLPRAESPVRRKQMTAGSRPSMGAPTPKGPARYGSPTNRFAQSVRGTAGDPSKKTSKMPGTAQRSASALGFDEESAPSSPQRRPNGLSGSISAMNLRQPSFRANAANDEEIERLRGQLEDRDRQLKEQASALAEMESSLVELQGLIENSDVPKLSRNSYEDKDSDQLRHMLREKNDKIAMLTSEFDAHRADFRSTIDTLELASTETERVYEKRIEELMGNVRELESRNLDVDSVANQLRQLEELVLELEEGLEDARRGEAEARGEAEFLRGDVERTKTELTRERERAGLGDTGAVDNDGMSKELEQKEDEIRGLKAIIHSLSRDSMPENDLRTPTKRPEAFAGEAKEGSSVGKVTVLEKQVAELQATLGKKNAREEELEHELKALRSGNGGGLGGMSMNKRSSLRDSRDTIIPSRSHGARSPEDTQSAATKPTHRRVHTLDTMHESDAYSTATEHSTLWCEICETSGHDILTCTNVFGTDGEKSGAQSAQSGKTVGRSTGKPRSPTDMADNALPAPLSPSKHKAAVHAAPAVKIMPNPMESGPVAGKESGVVDPEKWCAICERDGHDSVDCPFEDAF